MPHILYTAFDLVPSPKGAGTHIMHFLRGLVKAGYAVQLMTPGDGQLPAIDTYEGAAVRRVPPPPDRNFLAHALHFSDAVLTHVAAAPHYNVVHYRSIWSGLALAQNKTRFDYQTVFEVNGLPSIELKYHYPALRGSDLLLKIREQELATLALSDAIICPSGVTRAFLISLGVPRDRITVIPNGVSPHDFAATPLPDRRAAGGIPTILYLGTLADWQGLDLLLEAMTRINAQQPAQLRIVGRGRHWQRKQLSKRIRKLGLEASVILDATVPHHEVPEVIAQADVCVAPLALNDRNVTQGCCPIKVIEYMACARPIVAANLPVVRELAREDIDALLFVPDDADDLARQIMRVLNDRELAEKLVTSAAARARAKLTWHEAQKKLLRVYQRLLKH
ncbi:Mannosylfructose-phosphate synthase [Thermoflexales bacterium]|nr:Mannosylfructose-phosphate synthase [Thermoflexales bacterium]